MSYWKRIFGEREPPPGLDHPAFGRIVYQRHDGCWENPAFSFWGANGVQLLVDGGLDGPSASQEAAFLHLRDSRDHLLPRCLEALADLRGKMELPEGRFVVSGLTVPSLEDSKVGRLWTLWFDCFGDDHFWFGVQSDDGWETIHPFADD